MTTEGASKRQTLLFMTLEDEIKFSQVLTTSVPSIAYIDGKLWNTDEPPLKPSIHMCEARQAYLWNTDILPKLPTYRRKDGRFEGPSTGHVIPF